MEILKMIISLIGVGLGALAVLVISINAAEAYKKSLSNEVDNEVTSRDY